MSIPKYIQTFFLFLLRRFPQAATAAPIPKQWGKGLAKPGAARGSGQAESSGGARGKPQAGEPRGAEGKGRARTTERGTQYEPPETTPLHSFHPPTPTTPPEARGLPPWESSMEQDNEPKQEEDLIDLNEE